MSWNEICAAMNKQQFHFKCSAERLLATTGRLYFWTFTFKQVHHAWQYAHLWHAFTLGLEHCCPDDTLGMRVLQMHPGIDGRGHGFHYHCLFNRYIDARRVWRLCRLHGMGCDAQRVKRADYDRSIAYLSRYLTVEAMDFPIRVRRVASMFGFPMDRIVDIKCVHPHSDSARYLSRFWGRSSIGVDTMGRVYTSANCTGDFKTLLVGLHYKQFRTHESFDWTHDVFENMLEQAPYRDWVCRDDTIYNPTWLPSYLEPQPF